MISLRVLSIDGLCWLKSICECPFYECSELKTVTAGKSWKQLWVMHIFLHFLHPVCSNAFLFMVKRHQQLKQMLFIPFQQYPSLETYQDTTFGDLNISQCQRSHQLSQTLSRNQNRKLSATQLVSWMIAVILIVAYYHIK